MKINAKNILTILIAFIMILTFGSAVIAQDGNVKIEQTLPAEIYPNDTAGQNYKAEITNDTGAAVGDLEVVLNPPTGFSLSESLINEIKIVDENDNEAVIPGSDYNFSADNNRYTITPVNDGILLDAGSSIVIDYNLSTVPD